MKIALSFIFVFFFAMTTVAQKDLSSLLNFESESIDLGSIEKGAIVKSKFSFQNISAQEVAIEFVSTCECTDAEWPTKTFLPGEKGEIPFTFDSNKKDVAEAVDVDVILKNVDQDGNPVFYYLQYTFTYKS